MPRGGIRPGAGRRKGSKSAKTQAREAVALKALEDGVTPLEIMLEAMRNAYAEGGAIAAAPFAKEAAPYVHPKLSSINAELNGQLGYIAQPVAIPVEEREWHSSEPGKPQ